MDIFDFMLLASASVIGFIGYILFFNEKRYHEKIGHYSLPGWNFFIKRWWVERELIRLRKKEFNKNFKNYQLEEPKRLENEKSSDSQLYYGTDMEGNSLQIKLTRQRHKIAEVWLILRLNDGSVYTLPNHPDTRVTNANTRMFDAAGVKFECLTQFSRWRIIFNGMLRLGVQKDIPDVINEEELRYVKFNFIFAACSDPLHWPSSSSTKLLATAISTERWRDGNWMNMNSKPDFGGYDQFGSMFGQVFIQKNNTVEDMNVITLNLPGIRQRRWGPYKLAHLHRTGSIIGVFSDGTVFVFGAFSSKYGITHSQYGHVRTPSGEVLPIDSINFHLSKIGENHEKLPNLMRYKFFTKTKMYSTIICFKNELNVSLLGGRPINWSALNVPIELELYGFKGYGTSMFWYPQKSEQNPYDGPQVNRIGSNSIDANFENLVFPLFSREAQSKNISGELGASLAILTSVAREKYNILENDFDSKSYNVFGKRTRVNKNDRLIKSLDFSHKFNENQISSRTLSCPDYEVPNGFVLSSSAFELQIQKNKNISDAISEIEDIGYKRKMGNLEQACIHAELVIASTDLESKIKSKIQELIFLLLHKKSNISIVSSPYESCCNVLSTKMNNINLNPRNEDELYNSIKMCWASLYNFKNVQHRIENIQPIRNVISAVVYDEVVASENGVIFTQDPNTRKTNNMIIKLSRTKNVIAIIKRNLKNDKFTILNSQGHHNLSEDQILQLCKIGVALEKMYGSGQEIEWALSDGKIYLLQSRPILNMNTMSEWELFYEHNSAIMCNDDAYTTASIHEEIPDAVTQLTASTIIKYFDIGCTNHLSKTIKSHTGIFSKIIHTHQNQVFLDLYASFLSNVNHTISLKDKIIGYNYFGSEFVTDKILKVAKHRNGIMNILSKLFISFRILKEIWEMEEKSLEFHNLMKTIKGRCFYENLIKYKNAKDLLMDLEEMLKLFGDAVNLHSRITRASEFCGIGVITIMLEGCKEIGPDDLHDINVILNTSNDDSYNLMTQVKHLIKIIYKTDKVKEFIKLAPSEAQEWLKDNSTEAFNLFNDFAVEHYNRGINEFELMATTWGMNSHQLIQTLQTILKCNISAIINIEPRSKLSVNSSISILKTPKKIGTRNFLKHILPIYQKSIERSELSKRNILEFIHELRVGFKYLMKLLLQNGTIPNENLFYFLTIEEIHHIIKFRDAEVIHKATRRKELHQKYKLQRFPKIFEPILENASVTESKKNHIYHGLSICEKNAVGRACVINCETDLMEVREGDILVARTINFALTPYFLIVGGVITESGGLTSHAASLARKFQIPCITGVDKVTRYVKTGETIEINGKDGYFIHK